MSLLVKQIFDAAVDGSSEGKLARLSSEIRSYLTALEECGIKDRFTQDGIVTRWTGVFNQRQTPAFLVAEAEILDNGVNELGDPGDKIKVRVNGAPVIDDADYEQISQAVALALQSRLSPDENRQFMRWCRAHRAALEV